MPHCKKCSAHFPNRTRINGEVKNISKRSFCFACSPVGSRNTRDLTKLKPSEILFKRCNRCLIIKHKSDFYLRKEPKRENVPYASCKMCTNSQQRDTKKWAVEYKGGKCQDCGYNRCQSALEFHHLDPSKKDFIISRAKYKNDEKTRRTIQAELDKCVLVCSNCHRERHARDRGTL